MTCVRVLVVAALLAGLAVACSGGDDASGDAMPGLTLERLGAEGEVALDELASPAVVNLWANWCAPCRTELPAFDSVADEVGDEVRFVGINVGDPPDVALELIAELELGFEQLSDRSSDVSAELDVTSMPTTFFVDEGGAIVARHAGAMTESDLRAQLEESFRVGSG